jgi:DNA-binding NarL/FixJ family response regulator
MKRFNSSLNPVESLRMIRVLVVEDHPVFSQGVRRILECEPDLQVVGEVADGGEAVVQALLLQPDVILMDINLPNKNGLQITQEIKKNRQGRPAHVIILTAYHDEEQLYHALQAGASAYFPKDVLPTRLIEAIRSVAEEQYVVGDVVMNRAQLTRWLIQQSQALLDFRDVPNDMLKPLSSREIEVVRCIAQGSSNKEIARYLGISQQTVKNHMTNILDKLSVSDRTQAVVLALRRGWIRLDETMI